MIHALKEGMERITRERLLRIYEETKTIAVVGASITEAEEIAA